MSIKWNIYRKKFLLLLVSILQSGWLELEVCAKHSAEVHVVMYMLHERSHRTDPEPKKIAYNDKKIYLLNSWFSILMKINKYVTNDISNFEKQRKTTEHPTCKRNIEKYMYILSCNIYNKFWSWRSEKHEWVYSISD